MMVPLNNNSDTSTMPSGIDRDHLATTTESSDWNVPVTINGLDSGINFPVNSVHDDINIKTSNPELDSADWPIRTTKRKLHSMDDISETGDICDLFFHQPAKKLSLLFNTKFRYKEERKRILKLSIAKLRQVDDPEVFLRRSVLINNTVRRLHKELREEKLNRSSRFLHATYDDNKVTSQLLTPAKCRLKNEDELTCTTCLGVNVLKDPCRSSTPGPQNKSACKRPLETPNQQEPIKSKQAKQETTNEVMQSRFESEQVQPRFDSSSSLQSKERRDNSADRENSGVVISEIEKQYSQYSCGQSSIFGELQSVVFHSLIASLES